MRDYRFSIFFYLFSLLKCTRKAVKRKFYREVAEFNKKQPKHLQFKYGAIICLMTTNLFIACEKKTNIKYE